MKADAAAQERGHQGKDRQAGRPTGCQGCGQDADWAEQDAADAIDYAVYVVYDAQLAVLDALDARVYADERAKIAGT